MRKSKRLRRVPIFLGAVVCLLGFLASAAPTAPRRIPFADVLTSVQRSLLVQIELGKLARDRGQTELVRSYGDRLARDNQLGLRLLTSMADDMKVPFGPLIPEAPHEKVAWERNQTLRQELGDAASADFDMAYLRAMETTEREAVEALNDAVGNLPVSQARDLIQKLRPISMQHRELASVLLKRVGKEKV